VYTKVVDTKTPEFALGTVQNKVIYNLDGTTSDNTNFDRWSALVSYTGFSGSLVSGENYVFTVQTTAADGVSLPVMSEWSNPVVVP
jgi:hypothetical protein